MIYQETAELKFRADLVQAQAQAAYAQHLLNAQINAARHQYAPPLTQAPPATSEVAAEARQGLLIEGTARRVNAP